MKKKIYSLVLAAILLLVLAGCSVLQGDAARTTENPNRPISLDLYDMSSMYYAACGDETIQDILDDGLELAALEGAGAIQQGGMDWHSLTLTFYKRHSGGQDGGRISYAMVYIDAQELLVTQVVRYTGPGKGSGCPVFDKLAEPETQIYYFDRMMVEIMGESGDAAFSFILTENGSGDALFMYVDEERTDFTWSEDSWV